MWRFLSLTKHDASSFIFSDMLSASQIASSDMYTRSDKALMHTFRRDVGGEQRSVADTGGESPFWKRETDNWFGSVSGEGFCRNAPEDAHHNMDKYSLVRLLVLLSDWFNFYRQTVENSSWGGMVRVRRRSWVRPVEQISLFQLW